MNAVIKGGTLRGAIPAVPSKSDVHRKLICAAFADRPTVLEPCVCADDIMATMRCLEALGADIGLSGNSCTVNPISATPERVLLDCGESGSTLRFLLPCAAAVCPAVTAAGRGRLPQRPIEELLRAMEQHGVRFSSRSLPIVTHGLLGAGVFSVAGNISSQYITGMILALSLLGADSTISLATPLESAGYVDMTLDTAALFGGCVTKNNLLYNIKGTGGFRSRGHADIEGDWSNAAFFLVAGALNEEAVTVTGLHGDSRQGDRAVIDILRSVGADISAAGGAYTVSRGKLCAFDIDVRQIPDLFPILAALAAFTGGKTRFTGISRLRFKESDRAASVAAMLSCFGIESRVSGDEFIVCGGKPRCIRPVDSANDHRIAMAAAVMALYAGGGELAGCGAVSKSYPGFFDDINKLGGAAYVD